MLEGTSVVGEGREKRFAPSVADVFANVDMEVTDSLAMPGRGESASSASSRAAVLAWSVRATTGVGGEGVWVVRWGGGVSAVCGMGGVSAIRVTGGVTAVGGVGGVLTPLSAR